MKIKLLFFLFCILFSFTIQAEEERKKYLVSGSFGYANMLRGTNGLTNSTTSYVNELCSGLAWEGTFFYKHPKRWGFGAMYAGYNSKGKHFEGADHIITNYFAPQVGFFIIDSKRIQTLLNCGIGIHHYFNNSKVFGKSRRTNGSEIGINIGLNLVYKINLSWGIVLNTQYINGDIFILKSKYHGEKVKVTFTDDNPVYVSRLNILVGSIFYF